MKKTTTPVRGWYEGTLVTITTEEAQEGWLTLLVAPDGTDGETVGFQFIDEVARRFLPFIGQPVRVVLEADAQLAQVPPPSEATK